MSVVVGGRKWVIVAVSLFFTGVLIVFLRPDWVVRRLASRSPDVLYFVETAQPLVALTIDDGPDPTTTPMILDVLERHSARATFFVITDNIHGNEHLLARALAAGHELGNHMTRDEPSHQLPIATFEAELRRAHAVVARFHEPRWFRPGGGWFSAEMVAVARHAGYDTALGSVYPFDTTIRSARFAAWYVNGRVRPGSIIVLHDRGARGRRTAAALERILPTLAELGLSVVTLSALAGTARD